MTENKDTGQPVQACSINICSLGVPSTSTDTVMPVAHDMPMGDRAATHHKCTVCAVEVRETDGESHLTNISHGQTGVQSYTTPGSFNRVSTMDLGAVLETVISNGSVPILSSNAMLTGRDTSGVPTTGNVGVGISEFQQTQQESLTNILLQMQDTLVSQVSENQRILQ